MPGTAAISQVRASGGKRPCNTPTITWGKSSTQDRKGIRADKSLTLDTVPTKAEGSDQKAMAAAIAAIMKKRRMMCSHHLIRSELQTMSSGRIPMKRGDMCNGW